MFRQLSLFQRTEVPFAIEIHRKAYQRAIRLTVQVNGRIRVTAARSVSQRDIQKFVLSHRAWIESCLDKFKELRARYPQKRYVEGEGFLFRGETVYLRIRPEMVRRVQFAVEGASLVCRVPLHVWETTAAADMRRLLRDALLKFYASEGERLLHERVRHYSAQMGLLPSGLSFRSQKTRWGSCSSTGHISLNWRLVVVPPAILDYVVVHELAHLKHHNHSQAFWLLVKQHIADYQQGRLWLKRHQYEADFLAKKSELHPDIE